MGKLLRHGIKTAYSIEKNQHGVYDGRDLPVAYFLYGHVNYRRLAIQVFATEVAATGAGQADHPGDHR